MTLADLRAEISQSCPGVLVDLRRISARHVSLDLIVVPAPLQGQGMGTRALTLVTSYADATGTVVSLTATAGFGADLQRLTAWYAAHGFILVSAGHRMMRTPEAQPWQHSS